MATIIEYIIKEIEKKDTIHAKKVQKNLNSIGQELYDYANPFLEKYSNVLKKENKNIDYAIDCYLKMISDMKVETLKFYRSGKYSNSTFEEVNKHVYNNPEVMEYFMHGLMMSQFLWKHHFLMFKYFATELEILKDQTNHYLEIGAGHGLYLSQALDLLHHRSKFSVVDISKTSIEIAKALVSDDRVEYSLKNAFDIDRQTKYDMIVMGEVLEHLEKPNEMLELVHDLLSDDGRLFISVPTNAPTIDHIYLFNNVQEIRELVYNSGFAISSEKLCISEDVSESEADEQKISILYGAILKKNN